MKITRHTDSVEVRYTNEEYRMLRKIAELMSEGMETHGFLAGENTLVRQMDMQLLDVQ